MSEKKIGKITKQNKSSKNCPKDKNAPKRIKKPINNYRKL